MKLLCTLAAGLGVCTLSALAEGEGQRLAPPVNVLRPAEAPAPGSADETAGAGAPSRRPSMVIEENGAVRFLSPVEAADQMLSEGSASRFHVELRQAEDGPDSLWIEVTGAEITESVTTDGATRVLRVQPADGSPGQLITITKD